MIYVCSTFAGPTSIQTHVLTRISEKLILLLLFHFTIKKTVFLSSIFIFHNQNVIVVVVVEILCYIIFSFDKNVRF